MVCEDASAGLELFKEYCWRWEIWGNVLLSEAKDISALCHGDVLTSTETILTCSCSALNYSHSPQKSFLDKLDRALGNIEGNCGVNCVILIACKSNRD